MKRRKRTLTEMELLEDRSLLSASAIFSQATGLLRIKGDQGNDTVSIEGTGVLGGAAVYVNGGHVGNFNNIRGIKVSLGAGNDTLSIGAFRMNGNLTVSMGDGADQVIVDNIPDQGGPAGSVAIGGNVRINMGNDVGDLIDWKSNFGGNGTTISGSVRLSKVADIRFDGSGGTYAVENGDISIHGDLKIQMNQWGDTNGDGKNVNLDDVNVLKRTQLKGSRSFDRMLITDSRFTQSFTARLGTGQNDFDLDDAEGPNWFGDRFSLTGKGFMETYDASPANVFNGPVVVKGIENVV